MAGTLSDVTDTNFQAEVLESDVPVLVDFWAPWCGPCRVVAPVLEEIAAERSDLKIVKLNVDENQQTAANFEVLSIPTLILFKNGAVAKKVIGAYPKRKLEAELEPALTRLKRLDLQRQRPRFGGGPAAVEGDALRLQQPPHPLGIARARCRRSCRRPSARGARRRTPAASAAR